MFCLGQHLAVYLFPQRDVRLGCVCRVLYGQRCSDLKSQAEEWEVGLLLPLNIISVPLLVHSPKFTGRGHLCFLLLLELVPLSHVHQPSPALPASVLTVLPVSGSCFKWTPSPTSPPTGSSVCKLLLRWSERKEAGYTRSKGVGARTAFEGVPSSLRSW